MTLFNVSINIGEIDLQYQHHLWYSGEVARITYKGYTFVITAAGDVRVNYYDKPYEDENGNVNYKANCLEYVKDKGNNNGFWAAMCHHLKNDDELFKAIREKRLEILDSNSFEYYVLDSDGYEVCSGDVLDAELFTDAIEETLWYLDITVKSLETVTLIANTEKEEVVFSVRTEWYDNFYLDVAKKQVELFGNVKAVLEQYDIKAFPKDTLEDLAYIIKSNPLVFCASNNTVYEKAIEKKEVSGIVIIRTKEKKQ